MNLTHKDYKRPVGVKKVIPSVKAKIKTFVGKGTKSYEEIVKEIQKSNNMTNDEVIKQVKELAKTADFTPKVIEMIDQK